MYIFIYFFFWYKESIYFILDVQSSLNVSNLKGDTNPFDLSVFRVIETRTVYIYVYTNIS